MSKQYDVVALGELLIDFTMNGQSAQGNPLFEANPGGAPCNALAILKKYGKNTGFIGKVGKDQFGEMLKGSLEEVGISTEGLVMDKDVNTTLAFVHTAPDGDRSFSFYRKPGADMMLTKDEVNCSMIEDTRIFHFGSLSMTDEIVREATVKAVTLAKQAGALVSFDPNLRPPLWESMDQAKAQIAWGMSQCDIMKIADDEILFMTGETEIEKAIEKLLSQYQFKLLLVTLGKDGSMAICNGHRAMEKGFVNPNTIETTGAGDTFCGSILNYCLDHPIADMDEKQLREMLIIANAGASLITTRKGALRVMPEKTGIMALAQTRL